MLRRIRQLFDWHLTKRSIRFWWQRRTRGWDNSELWGLEYYIAKFTLPRLKKFKEVTCGYPSNMTEEQWHLKLDHMIYALESTIKSNDMGDDWQNIDWDRVHKGFKLFGKHFRSLWY